LQRGSRESTGQACVASRLKPNPAQTMSRLVPALFGTFLLLAAIPVQAGLAQAPPPRPSLPDAPQPRTPAPAAAPATLPCPAVSAASDAMPPAAGNPPPAGAQPVPKPAPCPPQSTINWYMRFTNGPQVKPLTPKEKGWLAVRNVVDPFNGLTILGASAISVGSDADSPYGPGMKGFARNVGVSYTQDMTGEFFGTFLIPSLVHQDPHYHRMPNAKIPRRAAHAIAQVVWTLGDNGKPMVNYANLAGFAIEDEIGDLYVPGRQTNLPASAERYAIDLATAPVDNFVTEFMPDVARRIHIRVVLIQRIINQIAKTPGTSSP